SRNQFSAIASSPLQAALGTAESRAGFSRNQFSAIASSALQTALRGAEFADCSATGSSTSDKPIQHPRGDRSDDRHLEHALRSLCERHQATIEVSVEYCEIVQEHRCGAALRDPTVIPNGACVFVDHVFVQREERLVQCI